MSDTAQELVKLTINDRSVEVPAGTMILPAAEQAGVYLPRFCYHPDLPAAGNCRICQVEVEGMPKLVISCMTPVKDGMVVRTETERVKKAVQGDLEFLLANHPVDCPICDQAGECSLQDFYMTVGLHESRVPLTDKLRKRKLVRLGQTIVLDSERCVMCSRCIRFSDLVSKTSQLGFFQRGSSMEIGTFRDEPLDDPYSGCYADVCPVGALTSADFRFRKRVWFLQGSDSVCPECSTGCNIRIDHHQGQVYRFVPRRNPDVNRSWICDQGRFSYKLLTADRLESARVEGQSGQLVATALERVQERLARAQAGSGVVVGLATPRASCEALYAFAQLIREALGSPHLDYRVDPAYAQVAESEDGVLRRRDHNPNSRGAELLGLTPAADGWTVEQALQQAAEGRVDVLFLLGPELLTRWPDGELVKRALEGSGFSVLLDTHEREQHAMFDVVLPRAALAESDGTLINYDDRLQRFRKAVDPPGEARPDVELLGQLLSGLGHQPAVGSAELVFEQWAEVLPATAGSSLAAIDPQGVSLQPSEEKAAS